jgi:excisionase family DNA binding protein
MRDTERELFTSAETCDLLKVSRWTLWRLVRNGALMPYWVGGRKRFHIKDIRRLKGPRSSGANGCR